MMSARPPIPTQLKTVCETCSCAKTTSSSSLEQDVVVWVKTKCRELYNQLEEEYESLTSDEVILDTLEANDMLEDAAREAREELGYELETETQVEPAVEASH